MTVRNDTVYCSGFLLPPAKDATITARRAFLTYVIEIILPFIPSCHLFIKTMAINICQKSLTHELVVKVVVYYFRQITKDDANYVTIINSLNTISYLCAIIRTIHVQTQSRLLSFVNG